MKTTLETALKTVLVFQNGELINQIGYKTKADARRHFCGFKKRGVLNPKTGEIIKNTHFELL